MSKIEVQNGAAGGVLPLTLRQRAERGSKIRRKVNRRADALARRNRGAISPVFPGVKPAEREAIVSGVVSKMPAEAGPSEELEADYHLALALYRIEECCCGEDVEALLSADVAVSREQAIKLYKMDPKKLPAEVERLLAEPQARDREQA